MTSFEESTQCHFLKQQIKNRVIIGFFGFVYIIHTKTAKCTNKSPER